MGSQILMSFFVSVYSELIHMSHSVKELVHTVFRNIMKVVTADDDSAGHFCRYNFASQDAATDRNITTKRALLV